MKTTVTTEWSTEAMPKVTATCRQCREQFVDRREAVVRGLVRPGVPAPLPRTGVHYCSEECRDADEVVQALASAHSICAHCASEKTPQGDMVMVTSQATGVVYPCCPHCANIMARDQARIVLRGETLTVPEWR